MRFHSLYRLFSRSCANASKLWLSTPALPLLVLSLSKHSPLLENTPHKSDTWVCRKILSGSLLSSRCRLFQSTRPNDCAPSLHVHYRHFITTTGASVPVPCTCAACAERSRSKRSRSIGTLALRLLPLHQDDRFSCSVVKPILALSAVEGLRSCPLAAGCRAARHPIPVGAYP